MPKNYNLEDDLNRCYNHFMWFILALSAGLLFAINKLIIRSSLSKNVNPLLFGAFHELLAGLLLLPIAIVQFTFPHSNESVIYLILGVIMIFLADLFSFLSLKNTEASLYQIVGQLRHGLVLLGAFLLFTEPITIIKVVSILLIMIGVAIALIEKSRIKITRGIIYAFLSTSSVAFGFLFIKKANVDFAPSFSGFVCLTVAGILMYIAYLTTRRHKAILLPHTDRKSIIITAAIFAVFEYCLFTALKVGDASRVTPVMQSSMVFTLIGGFLFLNERHRITQKIIGSIFIIVGIGMLYFI